MQLKVELEKVKTENEDIRTQLVAFLEGQIGNCNDKLYLNFCCFISSLYTFLTSSSLSYTFTQSSLYPSGSIVGGDDIGELSSMSSN